jgi:hypothetical protein
MPYESGFQRTSTEGHAGQPAFVCANTAGTQARGAQNIIRLDQKEALPFVVTAWSKADQVDGSPNDGYSLYIDLTYQDGDHLWGTIAPFDCGTHDWEERKLRVFPSKPVKEASVYVLLRAHAGKAWFSDISLSELGGKDSFDFQTLPPPSIQKDGWYVRDLAKGGKLYPAGDLKQLGLTGDLKEEGSLSTFNISDKTGKDRALTLYYCERVDATGGTWWNTIRESKTIQGSECAKLTNVPSGANGLTSLYPFAAIAKNVRGWMIALPPSLGPRPTRLFYNPTAKLLCAAFDVALTRTNEANPGRAWAEVYISRIDPRWGLRDAARRYYAAFPDAFKKRVPKEGVWIPFTNPAEVPHPEDFGITVHEGDDSVASDARLGVLSFRYTEPMTWWMNMDPSIPRTYNAALQVLKKYLTEGSPDDRKKAQAVYSSATLAADGRYNVSFENQPWANGAVWVLNPNPHLPHDGPNATQADVDFNWPEAQKRYADTPLSGEYLDSLEDHAEVLDYRPESLAASTLCPSFDTDNLKPVLPQAFSTYELTRYMSDKLHSIGKLLMANSTPREAWSYMPLLDDAGIEVNWAEGGGWTPDSDDIFCYRRTMAYHKPYMLLQNTDFSKFGPEKVSGYFKRCLFYAVYPSFFSSDASSHPYWQNKALFERDRPVFKAIIPLIRRLSESGWEPVTGATTDNADIWVERYGENLYTVFNPGSSQVGFSIQFEKGFTSAKDVVSGSVFPGGSRIHLNLGAGDCQVIEVSR